jgi:hypothetical protein
VTVTVSATSGVFVQQPILRPAAALSPPPPSNLLVGRGLLATDQPRPAQRYGGSVSPLGAFPIYDLSKSQVSFIPAEETEPADEPIVEVLAREPRRPPTTLVEERPLRRTDVESDVLPFVVALGDFIESERLPAARRMLDAAPTYVLSNPVVSRLRCVLSPPEITRLRHRDVDRSEEYEWLRTHGDQYRGRWVAVSGRNLITSASSLRELQEQLRAIPLHGPPLLHRIR